ncbi:MAG: heme ABC exporter ATP-binding protein CcmA [Pseudomonadota bacterium]
MQIEASALSVERGGRVIFAGLGFQLAAGEALLVKGPNGAGKSTLLRALAGLLPLAQGEITINPPTEARRAELCHYIGHADALKPALTLAENLTFYAALLGGGDIAPALVRLGLAGIADLPAGYLSAGQKRRAALARLVAIPRPIWLLDEPLTALDATSQTVVGDLMQAHLDSGGLIAAATHAPLPIAARDLVLGRPL